MNTTLSKMVLCVLITTCLVPISSYSDASQRIIVNGGTMGAARSNINLNFGELFNWGDHRLMGYLTTEVDPIFTAWDKDYADIINTPTIPTDLSDLLADSAHRTVTDAEKSIWNAKLSSEVDDSVSNELQSLSIIGSSITLSDGGGTVVVPSGGAASLNDLTDVDTTGKAEGKILVFDSSGNIVVGDDQIGASGTGDITSVTAGDNLSGGGTAGDVTLNLDSATISLITTNSAKVGITTQQAADIVTNSAKVSFDSTSSTRLANTSGTNTGDQTLPTALSDLSDDSTHRTVTDTEKSGWDAKLSSESDPVFTAWDKSYTDITNQPTTISSGQAAAITTNTAKVSFDSTSSTRLANTSGTNTGDQTLPTALSDLSDDTTHRTVTDTEKSGWDAKLGANPDIGNATGVTLTLSGTLEAESLTLAPPPSGTTGEMYVPENPDNGSNIVGFKAPDALVEDLLWTLPSDDGTPGQVLKTSGTKVLSWTDGSSDLTAPGPIGTATPNTGTFTALTADSFDFGTPAIGETGEIGLQEDPSNGTNVFTLKAPAAMATDITLTLPTADGAEDEVLVTDGSGTLSFAANHLTPVTAPTTATDTCTADTWAYDTSYIYICTATNTWRRTAIASW